MISDIKKLIMWIIIFDLIQKPRCEFPTILDMLIIDNPLVTNCLIDQVSRTVSTFFGCTYFSNCVISSFPRCSGGSIILASSLKITITADLSHKSLILSLSGCHRVCFTHRRPQSSTSSYVSAPSCKS